MKEEGVGHLIDSRLLRIGELICRTCCRRDIPGLATKRHGRIIKQISLGF
jgi:hypothetical protein